MLPVKRNNRMNVVTAIHSSTHGMLEHRAHRVLGRRGDSRELGVGTGGFLDVAQTAQQVLPDDASGSASLATVSTRLSPR